MSIMSQAMYYSLFRVIMRDTAKKQLAAFNEMLSEPGPTGAAEEKLCALYTQRVLCDHENMAENGYRRVYCKDCGQDCDIQVGN